MPGHRFHAAAVQRIGVRTEVYRVGKNKESGPYLARLDTLLRRHGPHEAYQATDGWKLRGPTQAEWEAWWHDRSAVIYEDDGMERDWNEVAKFVEIIKEGPRSLHRIRDRVRFYDGLPRMPADARLHPGSFRMEHTGEWNNPAGTGSRPTNMDGETRELVRRHTDTGFGRRILPGAP